MEHPLPDPPTPPVRSPTAGALRGLRRGRARRAEVPARGMAVLATLRARFAGPAEVSEDTLAGALYAVVDEVEAEQSVTIDATVLDDRPLDDCGETLAAATREALCNAARHAPGARIVVFAELGTGGSEVYVSDNGPGFDPEAIPPRRRGVRDLILSRMARVGGSATVESTLGTGTEVELRLPATGRASR